MHLPSYTTEFFSAARATSGILLLGLAVACGGGGGGDTNPSINLPPVNRAPTLEQFSPIDVLEGSQISVAVAADDADGDPLDVSLSGSDVAFFEYSADSGIQFAQIPDWEANEDADGNNVFEVTASVSDGNLSSSSLLEVTVVDALEGSVVDGPISNSLVFIDENNNAVLDSGEISAFTRTNGLFFLPYPSDPTDLPLLAHGGTDELTGNELVTLELRTVLKNASTEHISINLFTTMVAPLNSVEREAFDELLGDNIELEVISHLDIWRASIDGSEDARRAARLNLQLGLLVLTVEALATDTSDVAGALAYGFLTSSDQLADQTLRDSEALSHLISPVVDENTELDFANLAINTIATSLANINEVTSNSDIQLPDPILSDVLAIGQLALREAITSFIETGSYETFETSVAIETLLGPLSSNIESENTDGDALIDLLDPDDDNDNFNDSTDAFPKDGQEWTDTDGDGTGNNADSDDDNDGVADESDAFPLDDSESIDTDGDGTGNNVDEDDDNDGVDDIVDAFPLDPSETLDTDNDGIGNNADGDDDGDDVPDEDDAFPIDPSEQIDTDQDGIGNNSDIDDDNDGYIDDIDAFPLDPLEHLDTDLDGIGNNSDEDDDGDGVDDVADVFPLDPSEAFDNDGDGIGDNGDSDDDNDGTPDTSDAFPLDPTEDTDTDNDGVGNNADLDDDNDGVDDASDALPLDPTETEDSDGDGIGNNADTDDDNDGVNDSADAFPVDPTETTDTDNDGVGNNTDPDDDNDGVDDGADAFPLDPMESIDTDGDGTGNNADVDDDGDGVADSEDAFPLDPTETVDTDSDGVGNNTDTDDDDDGIEDSVDAFPLDPTESVDTDGDGIGNNADTDDDGDGVVDIDDAFPLDPSEDTDTDGDGVGNNADSDDDNDGVTDDADAFPLDPSETIDSDSDGIGNNADLDDDNDGTPDEIDDFPLDPSETRDTDGDGIGNNTDDDDDNDGVLDADDLFPFDPNEWADNDGDGIGDNADTDDDNDGTRDTDDAFPLDPSESLDTDGDGIGNNADPDDDNDGYEDPIDDLPLDPTEWLDTDGDGIGNNADTDDDNDGVADGGDAFPLDPTETIDTDGDGVGNNADTDDDGDGVLDEEDAFPLDPTETIDTDGDGVGNNGDADDDGDGVPDVHDVFPLDPTETLDTDGDGIGNNADTDDDGDGVSDEDDAFPLDPTETIDTDGDGIGNNADTDDDGDGVADIEDAFPLDPTETTDTDGDGIGNNADTDDDNDGVADTEDAFPLDPTETVDTDGDGVGNNADEDDDGDGVNDDEDAYPLDPNESRDTDGDGIGDNADTDDDADTVPDTEDNCPLISNTSQLDTDGDGDGNSCDVDDDNDTIEDGNDNCPLTPNPDQLDSDGDGWGDACGGLDDDDDTIPNAADNCPTIPNEDQLDTDSDGEGDVCDSDDDGDGVDDVIDPFPLDPNIKALPTVDGASLSLKSMPGSTAATVATNATAQDNRTVTYSLVSEPSYGTVAFSSSNNTLTYTTLEKSRMTDSFSYKASDSFSESLPAIVDINMTGDPLFKHQWHLDNTEQSNFAQSIGERGNDLSLEAAIKSGLTGDGIIVAVVDDGLELAHEDLSPNIVEGGSYDLKNGDTDPTREEGNGGHGTSVAGIIAARGWNDLGGRGGAPMASLKGFNYIEAQSFANYISAFGGEDYSSDVDIFNYSAGMRPRRAFTVLSSIQQSVITDTLPSMRNGKGAIFVKSAGNKFEKLYSGCTYPDDLRFGCIDSVTDTQHIFQQVIVTAALAADGKKSSYSSVGATTWISGFGGEYGSGEPAIMTTDQSGCERGYVRSSWFASNEFNDGDNPHPENPECNYTSSFNGTSSAAPSVSGGIALILEQEPELTYRDVKGIIAATARKVDTDFEPVELDGITYYDWVENAAGYSHHSWYGFGALDVDAAIEMVADYNLSTLGEQTISPWDDHASETVVSVPATGEATASVESTVDGTIEFVRVRLDLAAPGIQQMGVRLTSPAGTTVTLFQPKTPIDIDPEGVIYLATSALYGESTQGTWTLRLFDHEDDGLDITLNAWAIKFFYY